MTAQDRGRGGPLGALLFLLSLFLGSAATASGASDLLDPLARLGSPRPAPATALLQTGNRNNPDDEALGTGDGCSLPPCGPGVVTRLLWTRPLAQPSTGRQVARPRATYASYRARAPPAL